MRFSHKLLKQFVKTNINPEKLGAMLTEHSFEIEEVENRGGDFQGIVAAKVLTVEKHPNADRLRVVTLTDGKNTIAPVVCGAWNFEAGAMVALALPGAHIPHDIHSEAHEPFTLGKATIRGIESHGMICAGFELGLEDEPGQGILLLDAATKPGTPLGKIFGEGDSILVAALPANRPDLHSHWGLAREIAAIAKLKIPEISAKLPATVKPAKNFSVKIADKTLCPKYFGLKIDSVTVGPSPEFISSALRSLGLRPVNNIVDITNYVMLAYGQPLHAFDAAKISGGITVRKAKVGETFNAINHKQYVLQDSMLLITDQSRPLAIAGVMGGEDSEVSGQTTSIILEAANFNGTNVRQTAQKLGLRTDSSGIFEKGLHPALVDIGIAKALELLAKYADAQGISIAKATGGAVKPQKPIAASTEEINSFLGSRLGAAEIKKSLSHYSITVKTKGVKGAFLATPPWWRSDLENTADLSEEILKHIGYNAVKPEALPVTPQIGGKNEAQTLSDENISNAKNFWARLGYFEVQNYNFVSEKDILNFGDTPDRYMEVANPLSLDQRYMKRNPLIPLLKNIALNQHHFDDFRLFELGKQYLAFENEPNLLTAVRSSKNGDAEKMIMQAKGEVLAYFESLGHHHAAFKQANGPVVEIVHGGETIGLFGLVKPEVLKNFGVDGTVVYAKLLMDKVMAIKKDILCQPVNRFPSIQRDISIVVDDTTAWQNIEQIIAPVSNLVTKIELFEAPFLASEKSSKEYHKNLQNQGKKNLGIRLIFEAFDRTLQDAETASILDKIVLKLQRELNAEIR